MCHEGNATKVTVLCPVLLLVQNLCRRISSLLRYFSLVPHQLDHPVKLPEHGRVMVYPKFGEFNREFVWSHCLRICHRPQGPDQLAFCRFDPELVCDRPLVELFDDFESELIGFRVEKDPEERGNPKENPSHIPHSIFYLAALFFTNRASGGGLFFQPPKSQ